MQAQAVESDLTLKLTENALYIAHIDDRQGHAVQRTLKLCLPDHLIGPQRLQQDDDRLIRNISCDFTDMLLREAPFRCLSCKQPATRLIHCGFSNLDIAEPKIRDFPQAVCPSDACHVVAKQQWRETVKGCQRQPQPGCTARPCQLCGKISAARRCSRCRVIAYCSPTCQKADWPCHKKACRAPPAVTS